MLLTILLVMVVVYSVVFVLLTTGGNFASIPGVMYGIWTGTTKAVTHFLAGLSVWTVLFVILKLIAYGLFIISFGILTPPYIIDIEAIFAVPLAVHITSAFGLTIAMAFVFAYAIVFAAAAIYLALWWFILKDRI